MEMSGPGNFVADNLAAGGAVCGTAAAAGAQETSSSGTPAKVFRFYFFSVSRSHNLRIPGLSMLLILQKIKCNICLELLV